MPRAGYVARFRAARCRRPTPRGSADRGAEHLLRLPARSGRPHRSRRALDRCGGTDRCPHQLGGDPRIEHAECPRPGERRAPLRLVLRGRHLLQPRWSLCVDARATPVADAGQRCRHLRDAPPRRRCLGHGGRTRRGPTGVFNVVDDGSAPASEWMPFVAGLAGARSPRHVPEALVRVGAGRFLAYLMCHQPAVSNRRDRSELGWSPRYPDWHDGLAAVFSDS